MRRLTPLLLFLVLASLSGCFMFKPVSVHSWIVRPNSDPAPGPDVLYMDISVLEVPVGDRFVNEDVWMDADEQIVSPALRSLLDENGLRVGLIRGRTPDGLMSLLTSKRANANPVQSRRRPGNPAQVSLGAQHAVLESALTHHGKVEPLRFEQCQCQIKLTPQRDGDGKVRLQFGPQVEFHDPKKWSKLNPLMPLIAQGQRSTEGFPSLQWDLTLAANEYVIIGTRFDRPGTLGYQFMITAQEERPVQRLLALRAGQFAGNSDLPGSLPKIKSLAAQANGK